MGASQQVGKFEGGVTRRLKVVMVKEDLEAAK